MISREAKSASTWKSRRGDFELPPDEVYLDGAYCTPLPRAAREAVAEAYTLNSQPGRLLPELFFDYPDAVRERVAGVLGMPDDEVGVTTSTGFGALLVAQGIRWQPADRVLIAPDEFPTNVYPWLALRDRGVHVEHIGRRGRPLTPSDLEAALEDGFAMRVLAVAAVHYLTGDLHPLSELSALVHARGGIVVVDSTQAAGSVAVDWKSTGADVLLASGYKWLFGPYGTGAVWARRNLLAEWSNVNGNWWATENSRDFRRVLEYRDFALHGRRLDSGETASFLNLGAFRAGLDFQASIGTAAIEARHRELQDRLVAAIRGGPLSPVTTLDAPHRSPMLYLEVTGDLDLEHLQAELALHRVRVSVRANRLRVSPGAWNDESDVDAFAEAVARVSS